MHFTASESTVFRLFLASPGLHNLYPVVVYSRPLVGCGVARRKVTVPRAAPQVMLLSNFDNAENSQAQLVFVPPTDMTGQCCSTTLKMRDTKLR